MVIRGKYTVDTEIKNVVTFFESIGFYETLSPIFDKDGIVLENDPYEVWIYSSDQSSQTQIDVYEMWVDE